MARLAAGFIIDMIIADQFRLCITQTCDQPGEST